MIAKHRFAREIGKTTRGINKMIARGDLPPVHFHVGRTGYWDRRLLSRFLEERERRKMRGS